MTDTKPDTNLVEQRQTALSRWDSEGGAGPDGTQATIVVHDIQAALPTLTNTELVQLKVRVIALENIVLALLAQATDQELELVQEMSSFITPKTGASQHPLTLQASGLMQHMIGRARYFR